MATIDVPQLTQAVIDSGTVDVAFRADTDTPDWTPLPFRMVTAPTSYLRCVDVRYTVGAIKIYYTFQPNESGAQVPDVNAAALPNLPVRWTVRPG